MIGDTENMDEEVVNINQAVTKDLTSSSKFSGSCLTVNGLETRMMERITARHKMEELERITALTFHV